jgi:hypothetical protein
MLDTANFNIIELFRISDVEDPHSLSTNQRHSKHVQTRTDNRPIVLVMPVKMPSVSELALRQRMVLQSHQ